MLEQTLWRFYENFFFEIWTNLVEIEITYYHDISGLKANVSEAEHPLLCEGLRRQRGELAIALLVHCKDDPAKLARVSFRNNGSMMSIIMQC